MSNPDPITPKTILEHLNRYVVGNDQVKRILAAAFWENQRLIELDRAGLQRESLPPKNCFLFAGPPGIGKTLLARKIAEATKRPCAYVSAKDFSETGYRGRDVDEMLLDLLRAADGDVKRAEGGIILWDEADKLAVQDSEGCRDVSGGGVQQALLPYVQGMTVMVKDNNDRIPVRTHDITFVFMGVFERIQERLLERMGEGNLEESAYHIPSEELIYAGLMPEIVGRLTCCVCLQPLGETELRQILTSSELSPVKQLQTFFRVHGLDLVFDEGAIDFLIQLAVAEGTGARALNKHFRN